MIKDYPDPDPLLPLVVRGVRWPRNWLRWYLLERWVMKREGWRKLPDGSWQAPDG